MELKSVNGFISGDGSDSGMGSESGMTSIPSLVWFFPQKDIDDGEGVTTEVSFTSS